jgi:hypothetical protein
MPSSEPNPRLILSLSSRVAFCASRIAANHKKEDAAGQNGNPITHEATATDRMTVSTGSISSGASVFLLHHQEVHRSTARAVQFRRPVMGRSSARLHTHRYQPTTPAGMALSNPHRSPCCQVREQSWFPLEACFRYQLN